MTQRATVTTAVELAGLVTDIARTGHPVVEIAAQPLTGSTTRIHRAYDAYTDAVEYNIAQNYGQRAESTEQLRRRDATFNPLVRQIQLTQQQTRFRG